VVIDPHHQLQLEAQGHAGSWESKSLGPKVQCACHHQKPAAPSLSCPHVMTPSLAVALELNPARNLSIIANDPPGGTTSRGGWPRSSRRCNRSTPTCHSEWCWQVLARPGVAPGVDCVRQRRPRAAPTPAPHGPLADPNRPANSSRWRHRAVWCSTGPATSVGFW
jgi:hypothetical protein